MVALMSKALLMFFFIGVQRASGAKKCKWDVSDQECEFDIQKTGISFGGKLGEYMKAAEETEACKALSGTKTECEANNKCSYNSYTSKCSYKAEQETAKIIYGDMAGCYKVYKFYYSENPCNGHITAAGCNSSASCVWSASSDYDANATAIKVYDEDSEKCLDTKPAPGSCQPNFHQVLCGKPMNMDHCESADQMTCLYIKKMAVLSCQRTLYGDAKTEANMLKCMEEKTNCTSMRTSALAKLFIKDEKTAQDEVDIATAENACAAEWTCKDYADQYMPIPLLKDRPSADCESISNSSGCFSNDKCLWKEEEMTCKSISESRIAPGDENCILTKMQKLEGERFDTDAELVSSYKQKNAKYKACKSLQTKEACEADTANNCKYKTPVMMSCEGSTVKTETGEGYCFHEKDESAYKQERYDLMFGKGVVTSDVDAIEASCKALKTETTCTAAELTAEETSQLQEMADSSSPKRASLSRKAASFSITVLLSTLFVCLLSA